MNETDFLIIKCVRPSLLSSSNMIVPCYSVIELGYAVTYRAGYDTRYLNTSIVQY